MKPDAPWFDKIGIGKTCHFVAMCRGMVVLTRNDDGGHTLWLFNQPVGQGDARTMRARYADFMIGDPLEWLYR